MCTELSKILGVTYYPEKLARRNHFLFSVCSYVTMNKLFCLKKKSLHFSLAEKKNNKPNFSLICDSCTSWCAFFIFLDCISPCAFYAPQLPKCLIADRSLDRESQQLDF